MWILGLEIHYGDNFLTETALKSMDTRIIYSSIDESWFAHASMNECLTRLLLVILLIVFVNILCDICFPVRARKYCSFSKTDSEKRHCTERLITSDVEGIPEVQSSHDPSSALNSVQGDPSVSCPCSESYQNGLSREDNCCIENCFGSYCGINMFGDFPENSKYSEVVSAPSATSSTVICKTFNDYRPLKLIAKGMRRKNFYVVEVDVYLVSIYVLSENETVLRESLKLSQNIEPRDGVTLVLALQLARAIGTRTVVEAIVEALSSGSNDDDYKGNLLQFQDILTGAIGIQGLVEGDVIEFAYSGSDGTELQIGVRGKYFGSVNDSSLRKTLLSIYIGSKSLAPDILSDIFFDRQ